MSGWEDNMDRLRSWVGPRADRTSPVEVVAIDVTAEVRAILAAHYPCLADAWPMLPMGTGARCVPPAAFGAEVPVAIVGCYDFRVDGPPSAAVEFRG